MRPLLHTGAGRATAGLERRSVLDEPALWPRNRHVDAQSLRSQQAGRDGGLPCSGPYMQRVVARLRRQRRSAVYPWAREVRWLEVERAIPVRHCDFYPRRPGIGAWRREQMTNTPRTRAEIQAEIIST